MRSLHLLLAIEHRLPYGEPDETIKEAMDKAYRPLIEKLHEAHHVKLSLHYSGAILDWMKANDPRAVDLIQEMSDRGQIELLSGPRYDAVLHSIPPRDAHGQVTAHAEAVSKMFGERPRGMLLPMGAWDGVMPRLLAKTDIAYTFLDFRLLRAAGIESPEGWYVTEREGQTLGLFPYENRLNQLFPWGSARQIALALRERLLAGQDLVSVVVPAEWFGMTPGSHPWCWYEQGWISSFFRLLRSQSSWLKTGLATSLIEQQRPSGRVYPIAGTPPNTALPSLALGAARAFKRTFELLERGDDPVLDEAAPWVLGPPWEAMLTRHDAANRLHKYMLRVSAQVARLHKRVDRHRWATMRRDLYRGQGSLALDPSNGLRRGQIRHAAWAALTAADHAARTEQGRIAGMYYKVLDISCDGDESIEVVCDRLRAVVHPSAGGAISELQLWGVGNLINTFSRIQELWFEELEADSRLPALVKGGGGQPEVVIDAGTTEFSSSADVDDPEPWPQPPGLPPIEGLTDDMLTADRHRRLMFLEHFLGPQTSLQNLLLGQHPQAGDFLDAPYQLARAEREEDGDFVIELGRDGEVMVGNIRRMVRIDKRYRFTPVSGQTRLSYEISNRYQEPIQTTFAVEVNLNLDSQLHKRRYLQFADQKKAGMHKAGQRSAIDFLELFWEDLGAYLAIQSETPAELFFFPIYSPAQTATGYVRGFQGLCLIFAWEMELWGFEKKKFELVMDVQHRPSEPKMPRKRKW